MCINTEAQRRPAQHRRTEVAEADDRVAPPPISVLISDEPGETGADQRAAVVTGGALFQHQGDRCGCRRERAAREASLPMAVGGPAFEQTRGERVDRSVKRAGVFAHAEVAAVRWPSASRP